MMLGLKHRYQVNLGILKDYDPALGMSAYLERSDLELWERIKASLSTHYNDDGQFFYRTTKLNKAREVAHRAIRNLSREGIETDVVRIFTLPICPRCGKIPSAKNETQKDLLKDGVCPKCKVVFIEPMEIPIEERPLTEREAPGGYSRVKLKCRSCGLHFAVFTWHSKEWMARVREHRVCCPECGINRIWFFGVEDIVGEIYEVLALDASASIIHGEPELKEIPIDKIVPPTYKRARDNGEESNEERNSKSEK